MKHFTSKNESYAQIDNDGFLCSNVHNQNRKQLCDKCSFGVDRKVGKSILLKIQVQNMRINDTDFFSHYKFLLKI